MSETQLNSTEISLQRTEGWKWEGSKTDLSRSGRVEGRRVEGWRGG